MFSSYALCCSYQVDSVRCYCLIIILLTVLLQHKLYHHEPGTILSYGLFNLPIRVLDCFLLLRIFNNHFLLWYFPGSNMTVVDCMYVGLQAQSGAVYDICLDRIWFWPIMLVSMHIRVPCIFAWFECEFIPLYLAPFQFRIRRLIVRSALLKPRDW